MSLSAKQLGEKIGLNAQEMNTLLKEEGYLSGEPGNYNVTATGDSYVSEKSWSNGYGGMQHVDILIMFGMNQS